MRKSFLICLIVLCSGISRAQKLKLEKLEELLHATMDQAEENLFLNGYSFLSKQEIPDTSGIIHVFSNRKKTIGTAKVIWKGIYFKEPLKGFVKYITYDRNEFEQFRRLMVQNQFERKDLNNLSENSEYRKGNLIVKFEVSKDEYENVTFLITVRNFKVPSKEKPLKKISLKSIFKSQEE